MRKLTLILILALFSCEGAPNEEGRVLLEESRVKVYEYEGCEYIRVGVGHSTWGSHKGNCSNPIHKRLDK